MPRIRIIWLSRSGRRQHRGKNFIEFVLCCEKGSYHLTFLRKKYVLMILAKNIYRIFAYYVCLTSQTEIIRGAVFVKSSFFRHLYHLTRLKRIHTLARHFATIVDHCSMALSSRVCNVPVRIVYNLKNDFIVIRQKSTLIKSNWLYSLRFRFSLSN